MPTLYGFDDDGIATLQEMVAWWRLTRGYGRQDRRGLGNIVDRRIRGLLTASLSSGSTSFTIDNVTALLGPSPTTSSTGTVTVANTHNWPGSNNGLVRAEWCYPSSRWEAYQVTCSAS